MILNLLQQYKVINFVLSQLFNCLIAKESMLCDGEGGGGKKI